MFMTQTQRVEGIMGAQAKLMGVPRSVGDFFTWSPTLTKERKVMVSLDGDGRVLSRSEEHRMPRSDSPASPSSYVSEWRLGGDIIASSSARWSAVNVSQPLCSYPTVPPSMSARHQFWHSLRQGSSRMARTTSRRHTHTHPPPLLPSSHVSSSHRVK